MVFNFYTVTSFINFITSIMLAVFVILKNRKSQKNISFFILTILVSLWSLSYFFWQNVEESREQALFWTRTLMVFAVMIPAAYLHFTLALCEKIKEKKKILIFTYAFFSLFVVLNMTPYFIAEVEPIMNFKYWPIATPLFSMYLFFFFICVIYSFYLLILKYKSSTGVAALQLKYIIVGFFISFLSGSLNFPLWYGIPIPPVAHVLLPAYIILIAYAITRYRLMDIRVIARNLFLYFSIAFSLYVLFYLIAFLYKLLFGNVLAPGGYLLGLFIAPLFAILMYRGSNFLSNFINKYIFYSVYNYQQAIQQASQDLSRYGDIYKIADIIINALKKTLQPDSVALLFTATNHKVFQMIKTHGFTNEVNSYLNYDLFAQYFQNNPKILIRDELRHLIDKEQNNETKALALSIKDQMQKNDIFICIPLINNHMLSGMIIISEKSEKDSYTQEDFSLLETLSHEAQIAIDNTLLYKKVEAKSEYLKRALRSKNDFIRIANHQLNTPISLMKMAYSMMEDGTLTQEEGIGYLANGLKRMSHVVEDFWNALELEGEIKPNMQKNDIKPMIDEAIEDKKKIITEMKKDIKILSKKPNFTIPPVLCDIKQLKTAVHNLLENAIFYTKKGDIAITYELTEDNNYLKVSIKDTGIGFSKEDRRKIGSKLYRTKNALLMHPDGSGLGVYICKNIIEAHGGMLLYESEGEGRGSTFSFTLPIYK